MAVRHMELTMHCDPITVAAPAPPLKTEANGRGHDSSCGRLISEAYAQTR